MVWNFPLLRVKAKSITAKIHAIILQPRRKYYFSGWLVLSLIFLSTHHYRDMEALGTRASHCLSSDERGFPVWYAVKVIWMESCFCITCTAKQKQEKHFSPKTHFSLAFHYYHHNRPHLCDHNSLFREQNTTPVLLVWNESWASWLFQGTFKVPLYHCIEEH